MEKFAPNDPMPCGFARTGVSIKDRLKHYRACKHPDCVEKAANFKPLIDSAIMTPEGQPTFGASEMLAPVGKPHPFMVILPSGNMKKFITMADAERYVFQCAGRTKMSISLDGAGYFYTNSRGNQWIIKEDSNEAA